jgi:ParB family transcriptional regulator, chromosome partitioning protein
MTTEKHVRSSLREISPDKISRNPDNPRIYFRSEEMDTLMASIRRYGIQVPISVYQQGDQFVLIDGERRWRCALKLNLQKIPALVQEKPSPLQNLLLMFNIHALREQWDYLTIAKKLPDVIELFRTENDRDPTEAELSEITGLTRGQIRRCRFLVDLPLQFRRLLEQELELPKHQQKLSEDFFIEMERALKTVQKRVPSAVHNVNSVRFALIRKFRDGAIKNVTDFRKLSKIATSIKNLGVKESKAREAISEIVDAKTPTGITEIYAEKFELRYDERKITQSVESISEYLDVINRSSGPSISNDLRQQLRRLKILIERVLRG